MAARRGGGGGRTGLLGGGLGGLRDARMGGGGLTKRQQMIGESGAGAYGYTQDSKYVQHASGQQMRTGMGGRDGSAGLEALVGSIFGTGFAGGQNPIKRLICQNVLYLMIVNMPTEEELAAANTVDLTENDLI